MPCRHRVACLLVVLLLLLLLFSGGWLRHSLLIYSLHNRCHRSIGRPQGEGVWLETQGCWLGTNREQHHVLRDWPNRVGSRGIYSDQQVTETWNRYSGRYGHHSLQGRTQKKRKGGGGGGGALLRLDWDKFYLVPMKYCLRFKEETSTCTLTLPLGCWASTAAARLSLHHPVSRFNLTVSLTHAQDKGGGGGLWPL